MSGLAVEAIGILTPIPMEVVAEVMPRTSVPGRSVMGLQMKMLAVLMVRAEVIPAVRAVSVTRAVEVGCAGFFHDKGVVEVDIVVLEAVPECLQGVDVYWRSLDVGSGVANVVFPFYQGRWIDPMVVGAAIAHRTFKQVTPGDCQRDVQEEDDKEDGKERRHLEKGKVSVL